MKKFGRLDGNHKAVVDALRHFGATVQSLATIGAGCPDLIVGYNGENYLLEVKDGKKPASQKKLTSDQIKWIRDWKGQVKVVYDVNQATMAVMGL